LAGIAPASIIIRIASRHVKEKRAYFPPFWDFFGPFFRPITSPVSYHSYCAETAYLQSCFTTVIERKLP
jgi:hypothetical protein